jgi:hypothetical protein
VVNGGILDGVNGVVVDGSTYNVTFLAGSCAQVFNGCTSVSDFAFQTAQASYDATSALASILGGSIQNSLFPNGIVDEFYQNANSFDVAIFTPDSVTLEIDGYGSNLVFGSYYYLAVNYAYVTGLDWELGGIDYVYPDNNGQVWADWTPTAVPEPATWTMLLLSLFGIGFMMRGARRKDAVAVA